MSDVAAKVEELQPKMLFLEDTQQFADMFMRLFPDVDITHVSTFKDFQRALQNHDFSIVVSDVNVPMWSGERSSNYSCPVLYESLSFDMTMPVVFITSDPSEVDDELDVEVFDKINTADWKQHLETILTDQQKDTNHGT